MIVKYSPSIIAVGHVIHCVTSVAYICSYCFSFVVDPGSTAGSITELFSEWILDGISAFIWYRLCYSQGLVKVGGI